MQQKRPDDFSHVLRSLLKKFPICYGHVVVVLVVVHNLYVEGSLKRLTPCSSMLALMSWPVVIQPSLRLLSDLQHASEKWSSLTDRAKAMTPTAPSSSNVHTATESRHLFHF